MTEARFTRTGTRPPIASLFAILVLACVVSLLAGCDSKQQAGESDDGQSTTAPVDVPETARTIQLKNIAANRGARGMQAVRALVHHKTPGAFEVIVPVLKGESLGCRISVAVLLGKLGDPRALRPLQKALQSEYSGLRLGAVVGLGELGPAARPAVKQIGAMLNHQFPPMHASVKHAAPDKDSSRRRNITMRIHRAAIKALGQIGGPEAQAIVADMLRNPRYTESQWIVALALKTMDARQVLRAAGKNGNGTAWRMLGELKDTASFEPMIQCAGNPQLPESLRRQAIYALGRLQDPRAMPMLLKLLRSKSYKISKAAIGALSKIADPESLPSLLAYVKSAPLKSRGLYSATIAIGNIETPAALDAIRKLVRHPSPLVREACVYSLGKRATARDIPMLVGFMSYDYPPAKALTRLLPDSGPPLLKLLPMSPPKVQNRIIPILATYKPARPALRALLNSKDKTVRYSARTTLWAQRDPAVPLGGMSAQNLGGTVVDERDIPELKRLVSKGSPPQSYMALMSLFRHAPRAAWPHIKPLFNKKGQSSLQALNILGEDYPGWIEQELVKMLAKPEGLAPGAKRRILDILRSGNSISPEAVAIYRLLAEDGDMSIRHEAYECLCNEASDESMAIVARKALAGDDAARWVVGRTRDKRLARTFQKLVKEATEKKDTWVGGYVHCWPTVPGVVEYVDKVGSHYSELMMKARKTAAETIPD